MRAWRLLRSPNRLTYLGIALLAIGLVLLVVCWACVASTTIVALQLDYLVSAGLTAVAVVMIGLVLIVVDAKNRQVAARIEQWRRLERTLEPPPIEAPDTTSSEPPERSHDSGLQAAGVLAAALLVGLVLIAVVAWHGAATTSLVSRQLPFLVSAGLGGLVIVLTAGVLLVVHLGQRKDAYDVAAMEAVVTRLGRRHEQQAARPVRRRPRP